MQNVSALGAPPLDRRASGGWGYAPEPRASGGWGLRPQTPKTASPLRISGYAPVYCRIISLCLSGNTVSHFIITQLLSY